MIDRIFILRYSYNQYAQFCAQLVRGCLKTEAKEAAKKRENVLVRMAKWEQGKASGPSSK